MIFVPIVRNVEKLIPIQPIIYPFHLGNWAIFVSFLLLTTYLSASSADGQLLNGETCSWEEIADSAPKIKSVALLQLIHAFKATFQSTTVHCSASRFFNWLNYFQNFQLFTLPFPTTKMTR